MLEEICGEDVPAAGGGQRGRLDRKDDGREWEASAYVHSKYRPRAEGENWAAGLKSEDRYAAVVCGFGVGVSREARLWERMGGAEGDAVMVVAEPNLAMLKAGLMAEDYSEMLGPKGRVMFFTSHDRSALVERLELRSAMFTAGSGTLLTNHPASTQLAGAFFGAFQKLVTEFVSYTRTGFLTLMLNNVATCRNIANNLGRYMTTPPIDSMRDAYKGKPAILVAAGPSLQKNMHLLHELVEKSEIRSQKREGDGTSDFSRPAVIIAVQTMLKPLLAAGIEPDFVTSLDYNTVSTRFFENLEESGSAGRVHLVAQPTANWNVLDVFTGGMSLTHHDFAAKLLRDAVPPRTALKAGATVAHLSFYLAEYLGCDPIILIGAGTGVCRWTLLQAGHGDP